MVAKAPDADVFMLLQMVTKPQGQQHSGRGARPHAGRRLPHVEGERTTINGLEAFIGLYQGQIQGLGDVASRAAHIAHDGKVLHARRPRRRRPVSTGRRRVSRQHPLVPAVDGRRGDSIRPNRVDLYVVRAGDTWASLAERSGGAHQAGHARDHEPLVARLAAAGRRAHQDRRGGMTRDPLCGVRCASLAGVGGRRLRCASSYVYLTLPDVRPLATPTRRPRRSWSCASGKRRPTGEARRSACTAGCRTRASRPNLRKRRARGGRQRVLRSRGHRPRGDPKSIQTSIEKGEALRGASTITQQLAKNLYLSPSRDPLRKLKELIITRRLEAALSKARIFEIYLNVIEWGDRVWGAEAAARTYFGVPGVGADARAGGAAGRRDHQSPRLQSGAIRRGRLLRRQQIILARMAAGMSRPSRSRPLFPSRCLSCPLTSCRQPSRAGEPNRYRRRVRAIRPRRAASRTASVSNAV